MWKITPLARVDVADARFGGRDRVFRWNLGTSPQSVKDENRPPRLPKGQKNKDEIEIDQDSLEANQKVSRKGEEGLWAVKEKRPVSGVVPEVIEYSNISSFLPTSHLLCGSSHFHPDSLVHSVHLHLQLHRQLTIAHVIMYLAAGPSHGHDLVSQRYTN